MALDEGGARGFTLLELLVVLAILGLATALAGPALLRTVDSWRRQGDIDAVMEQVRALPMHARAEGRALFVDEGGVAAARVPLRAPEGWSLSVSEAWRVNANGACTPGELLLARPGREVPIRVLAPFCQPRRPAIEE